MMICSVQVALASNSTSMKEAEKSPLVIDSKNGLKCDKKKLVCTAEGEVIVRKGPYELHAKKASAFMKKDENGKMAIHRIEAQNQVKFFGLNGEKATAEKASFAADSHRIELRPGPRQQVIVWKDEYLLMADSININLVEGAEKKLDLGSINGKGHVLLSSPSELIEGDVATYTPKNKMIIMTGNVVANRHEGQLRGSYAEVNVDTKRSKVLKRNDVQTDGRVKVFVFPDKTDRKTLKSE